MIIFEGPVESRSLGSSRVIRIYLPPSYQHDPQGRFPVLYVQDGQNAFSTVGDHVAFGWGNWHLDQTVDELSTAGKMQEIIMVAIDCGPERYREYRGPAYPNRTAELADYKHSCSGKGDDYAFEAYSRFLIEELKPQIDRQYRTKAGPGSTGLIGSSMGGICSLAMAWKHPRVFGNAGSLSGAFQVERRFLLQVLRSCKAKLKPIRVYLDSGVTDDSGGDDGRKHTASVAQELRRMGWRDGIDLLCYADTHTLTESELANSGLPREKWKEAQISQHNEFYWRRRVWQALTFLFPLARALRAESRNLFGRRISS